MRLLLLAVFCAAFLSACGDDPASPEEQVRAYVNAAELAAEARDVGDISDLIADAYRDRHGQDKNAVTNLFRIYFVQHQSLHLLTRIEELSFPANDVADVIVAVGVLGREAEEISDWGLTTDLHRFRVQLLLRDDEWQATSAEYLRGAQ